VLNINDIYPKSATLFRNHGLKMGTVLLRACVWNQEKKNMN